MRVSILLAEDHDENRKLLRRRLERSGYHVVEAANGAEAVACARNERPDVVLMDLAMPVMDGIEAWREIQEWMDHPPPVIALTAAAINEVRQMCAQLGFDAFLTKPILYGELIAAIERLAPQKRTPSLELAVAV